MVALTKKEYDQQNAQMNNENNNVGDVPASIYGTTSDDAIDTANTPTVVKTDEPIENLPAEDNPAEEASSIFGTLYGFFSMVCPCLSSEETNGSDAPAGSDDC